MRIFIDEIGVKCLLNKHVSNYYLTDTKLGKRIIIAL